jgi:hypothetical protein
MLWTNISMKGKNDFFFKKGRGNRALQLQASVVETQWIETINIKREKMLFVFFSKRALRLQAPVISTIYIFYRYPLLDIKG